mgnify:CR=1 FL=1
MHENPVMVLKCCHEFVIWAMHTKCHCTLHIFIAHCTFSLHLVPFHCSLHILYCCSSSCGTLTAEPLLSNSRVASVKQVVIIEEFSKISNFGDFELFTSTIDNSASIRERGGLKKQNSLEFNPRHEETLFSFETFINTKGGNHSANCMGIVVRIRKQHLEEEMARSQRVVPLREAEERKHFKHFQMESVREDALMAVHRTMIVLRDEIEMKNRIIMKLRRQISRKKVV